MSKRILIIEDDGPFAQATRLAIERAGFLAEIANSISDVHRRAGDRFCSLDAVLLDLDRRDGLGEALLSELRLVAPRSAIIAFSAYLDGAKMCTLLQAKVISIMKPVDAAQVAQVLLRLFDAEGVRTILQREALFAQLSPTQLTRREHVVAELLAGGAANKDIARELSCSVKTVEFHVTNLLRKTGASSRLELISLLLRESA